MALVDLDDLISYMDSPGVEDDPNLETIQAAIEDQISKYCRRTFESTAYTLERYSGDGTQHLSLKNYPVISLSLLSIGSDDIIRVCNTNTGTFASISVTSTGVSLDKDGTATSLTFAAYTTMSTMVAAINATSGWSATLLSSTYDDYKSNFLLKKFGLNCIDSNYVYLSIPSDPEYDFEVFEDRGIIYRHSGFPSGNHNIFVTYTAGYATIPDDLQLAAKIFCKDFYNKNKNEAIGLQSYRIGDISYSFSGNTMKDNATDTLIPAEAMAILNRYRKRLVK